MKQSNLASDLLMWYDENYHNFPWRSTNDPYKIWLSEIMLQQTRVKTVVPFYNHWLYDLPNIEAVKCVNMDYILKKWEGLGYYARARNFHSACKIVVKKHRSVVPNDSRVFQSLPGVGPYISGAVMSIAYNQPIPAVDGNAYRVVSRIKSINKPFYKCKKEIVQFLADSISTKRPGDFNQAIMDLGREVCTVKNPACKVCPLENNCSAYVNNTVDKYPFKTTYKKKPRLRVAVGIIWKKDKILISKRRETGLLGGLWEFPGGKIKSGEGAKKCIIREVKEDLGIYVCPKKFIKQIRHEYTHYSISLDAYHCDYMDGFPHAFGCADWKWIKPKQISRFPFPASNHKLFDKIIDAGSLC